MAVDIARHVGEPRVYVLPAQFSPYYLTEDQIRFHVMYNKDQDLVKRMVEYFHDRNDRLKRRYDGTPRGMKWHRLPNKGPWYMDTGIDG
ncbi:MAG: hypothetical protein NUV65_00225 [Candidatus Roizmanbacteria bacterium]|nr:hypothetical protein [Candidatus Roizmanbacteria bacterium]